MTGVGFFTEMNIADFDNGSIKDSLVEHVDYDKAAVIAYLQSFKHRASCARNAIDCVTGKVISSYFLCYDDGEYCWCDFLIYHIQHYKIRLPQGLIEKANASVNRPE